MSPRRPGPYARVTNEELARGAAERAASFDWTPLREAAFAARDEAHAPFSKFQVGAAMLGSSGTIYTGCNIEVSTYGLTMCAERLAMFKAVQAGERDISHVFVVAGTEGVPRVCGACRQVLADFAYQSLVRCSNLEGEVEDLTVEQLIPHSFRPEHLPT